MGMVHKKFEGKLLIFNPLKKARLQIISRRSKNKAKMSGFNVFKVGKFKETMTRKVGGKLVECYSAKIKRVK